jgi:hypothetical protein
MVYRSMFFAWRSKYERAGLTRDTLYLVRPDTYIGLVDRSSSVETLHRYLDTRGMRIGSAEGREQKPKVLAQRSLRPFDRDASYCGDRDLHPQKSHWPRQQNARANDDQ